VVSVTSVELSSRYWTQKLMDFLSVYDRYRTLLLDGVVPFWLDHGIDWEYGGVLSCLHEDGALASTDKFLWSQARSVWTFAALYNRVEQRPEFLQAAQNSIRFLLAHGRDPHGRWVYKTDRKGQILEGATSIYTDCFVVYGLSEYYRAVKDEQMLALALETFEGIRHRIEQPGFSETAPYPLPNGWKNHGLPMIMTEVTNELYQTTRDPKLELVLDEYIARVMQRFRNPDRKVILEFLDKDYQPLPAPAGTFAMPGHAIESMWFVLRVAERRGDRELIRQAAEAMRWSLELGWDPGFGGIVLSRDIAGGEPYMPKGEMKIWWPHTEALYGTLLAHSLTHESWCLDWYDKVAAWSWSHFPMPQGGEWYQRLTREGVPTTEIVALPVKDPFHLPRAAMLIMELAQKMASSTSSAPAFESASTERSS
jgi:N-acylglucosamine 2-epimerase